MRKHAGFKGQFVISETELAELRKDKLAYDNLLKRLGDISDWECGHGVKFSEPCEDCDLMRGENSTGQSPSERFTSNTRNNSDSQWNAKADAGYERD